MKILDPELGEIELPEDTKLTKEQKAEMSKRVANAEKLKNGRQLSPDDRT